MEFILVDLIYNSTNRLNRTIDECILSFIYLNFMEILHVQSMV